MRWTILALAAALAFAAPAEAQLSLESHDVQLLGEDFRAERFSKEAHLKLTVRNETDQAVKAWRVQATVRDPFGDELFSIELTSGNANIGPGETYEATFVFDDNQFIDGEGYDKLAAYSAENLTVEFSDIRLVH